MPPVMTMPQLRHGLLAAVVQVLSAGPAALAQQPVQPLPTVGGCPLGYYSSGSYCVPSNSGNSCPLGRFSSGSYCVKSR